MRREGRNRSAGVPPAGSATVPVATSSAASRAGADGGTPSRPAAGDGRATRLVDGLHSRGVLPHLKREGGAYFVTFREAGTLPKEVLLRFKQERQALIERALAANRPLTWHEQEEVFRWYSTRVDRYLDAGHGRCHLRRPACAEIVAGALKFFDGQRYELRSWVVMPNHVHVVVWPKPPHSLSEILHSSKAYTAHEINKLLPEKIVPFWQNESYDHLIRNDEDRGRCSTYTIMNPVNAGLCADPASWRWSSAYVAQASPPASSDTVPVAKSSAASRTGADGGTPSRPAADDGRATNMPGGHNTRSKKGIAMIDKEPRTGQSH